MFITSLLGMINPFAAVFNAPNYILQTFLGLFGFVTMILEASNIPFLERLRPHVEEWAKFLTVIGGKGLFYMFQGFLAISLWGLLDVIVGAYMAGLGLLCVAWHFGLVKKISRRQRQQAANDPSASGPGMATQQGTGPGGYAPMPQGGV
mmetsp:Transcript_5225/g.14353  ORF Transcript_5225/g.14353 Transcript_5225/m.14353 type:complete len:149 (-) Transcript_5225:418-864(-)